MTWPKAVIEVIGIASSVFAFMVGYAYYVRNLDD